MSPGEGHAESYEARPPSVTSPGFIHVRNVEREIRTEHFHDRPQQANLVPRKDEHTTEAMTLVNFWHWLQRRYMVNVLQNRWLTRKAFVQNTLLSTITAKDHPGALTSSRKIGTQRAQLMAPDNARTAMQQPIATIERAPGIHQTTGLLSTILAEYALPMVNQRLTESSVGRAASAVDGGITNEIHQFAIIRKERQMEPLSLDYAFAQPVRHKAREERVISKVEEKEVVKLVQKEIQSYMSSEPLTMNFSRSDYARITDNVYASLARRLMVEKERLGIR
jgi:hypothetical protein